MPYIASKLKLTQMLSAMARMEMMADLYPNSRPKLTLVGNMRIASIIFCDKFNNETSPKNHNNTQEELPILHNFLGSEVEAGKGRPDRRAIQLTMATPKVIRTMEMISDSSVLVQIPSQPWSQ
jgi:hypothetical protein